jgi:hypothetical protein
MYRTPAARLLGQAAVRPLAAPKSIDANEMHLLFVEPLLQAARQGALQLLSEGRGNDGKWALLKVGDQAVPVFQQQWGSPRRTWVFEPVPATEKNVAAFKRGLSERKNSVAEALYGDKHQRRLAIDERSDGPRLIAGGDSLKVSKEYAAELKALIDDVVFRAERLSEVPPSALTTAPLGEAMGANAQTGRLGAVLTRAVEGARATEAGPGPGAGDDLVATHDWAGLPVLVTADRGGKAPMRAWLPAMADGQLHWVDMPAPDGLDFPVQGAATAIRDGVLSIIGGLDAKGDPLKLHWTLDLSELKISGTPPALTGGRWRRAPMYKEHVFASAVAGDGAVRLLGGLETVAKMNRKELGWSVSDAQLRSHETVRGGYSGEYSERGAMPSPSAAAPTIAWGPISVVGPGVGRDGKVSYYDAGVGGWQTLPSLPAKVGMGQLLRDGKDLFYVAGFDEAGAPSSRVFKLDMSSPDEGWTEQGSSPYLQGSAKLIKVFDRYAAIAVTPKGSRTFFLE